MTPPQRLHTIDLTEGEETEVVLTHDIATHDVATDDVVSSDDALGDAVTVFQLNLQPPHGSGDEEIERAVALARAADVAVVVVGTTEEVESEGFDRDSLVLPGRQDELVRRVAEVNPRTVVVVNSGAPVLLPWSEEVAAVLLAWFPGQEFGNALADVLLGVSEPGGRLPTGWPATERGCPPPNRSTAFSPTTRGCSSATGATVVPVGSRPDTPSATDSGTPPGTTSRSTSPVRCRPARISP